MGPRRVGLIVLGLAVAATLASPALAQKRPSAHVSYERGRGAETCPDEAALRAVVAARLGYEPFRDSAARTIKARIERPKGGPYRVQLELAGADGAPARRELVSRTSDCDEIFLAMTLAIAIVIDPMHEANTPSVPPKRDTSAEEKPVIASPTEEPPASAELHPPSEPSSEGQRRPLRVRISAMGHGSLGLLPSPAWGVGAGVGARWPNASLGLEGRWDARSGEDGPAGGSASASMLGGTVLPCLHHALFLGCLCGTVGATFGEGSGVTRPQTDTTIHSMLGARVGIEPRLGDKLRVHVHVEGDGILTPTDLRINGVVAWSSAPVAVTLAVGIVAEP